MKGTLRICKNGHRYYKSSDCPTCPVCETQRKPDTGFMTTLSAPARRALENAGITTLKMLARHSKIEVSKFHGMGPSGIVRLEKSLRENGLSFKD